MAVGVGRREHMHGERAKGERGAAGQRLRFACETLKVDHELDIVVLDLGGGTIDLTCIRISRDPEQLTFRVRCTTGRRIGGEDVTGRLAERVMKELAAKLVTDARYIDNNCTFPKKPEQQMPKEMQAIYLNCEEAKKILCQSGAEWRTAEHEIFVQISCPRTREPGRVAFIVPVTVLGRWLDKAYAPMFKELDDAWAEMAAHMGEAHMPSQYILVGGTSLGEPVLEKINLLMDGQQPLHTPGSVSTVIAEGAMKFHMARIKQDSLPCLVIDTVPKELGITYHDFHTKKLEYAKLIDAHEPLPTPFFKKKFYSPATSDVMRVTVRAAEGGVGAGTQERLRARAQCVTTK